MKRYCLILLFALLAGLAASTVLSALAYRNVWLDYAFARLFNFQLEKIRQAQGRDVDTVFVGDSSLGNAIDVRVWESLSGKKAINLALTGSYGYGGPYNMARRALAVHPKRIVIMQTIDIPTRSEPDYGFINTYPGWFPVGEGLPLSSWFGGYLKREVVASGLKHLLAHNSAPSAAEGNEFPADYVPQKELLKPARIAEEGSQRLRAELTDNSALRYLEKLALLCREFGVECVYVHGPLVDLSCRTNADYILRLNEAIRRTGLRLAGERPLCLPEEQVGDSIDHVAQAGKSAATRYYFSLLGN